MGSCIDYSIQKQYTIKFTIDYERRGTVVKGLGKRIRDARKQRKLTQGELAAIIQISPSYMSEIEMGKTNFSVEIFARISEALQISADWLLRTNIPEVNAVYNAEIAEVLTDCSPYETELLLKILKETKLTIKSAKI